MENAKMAYPRGLVLHGINYRVQKKIPIDCLHQYGDKTNLYLNTNTSDKREAAAMAWKWLAELELEFAHVRATAHQPKTSITDEETDWLISKVAHSIMSHDEEHRYMGSPIVLPSELQDSYERGVRDALSKGDFEAVSLQAEDWLREYDFDISHNSDDFKRFAYRFAMGLSKTIKEKALRDAGEPLATPMPLPEPSPKVAADSSPKLSKVVKAFLDNQDSSRPMYVKYRGTLGLFSDIIGDKAVSGIKQVDIDNFFQLICKLPPRWKDKATKQGKTPQQVAEENSGETIAPKTFEDTYIASLRPFLVYAIRTYGDQGFPRHLTANGIKYTGNQKEGKNAQRAFKPEELKRLFEGSEFAAFANDSDSSHKYWLPLIALYTGARVNEICQLNPQCDIAEVEDVWSFSLTEESEGDSRITKSIKNPTSKRLIPIHPELIKLGLIDYVLSVKGQGSKLIFPKFPPSKGKASGSAEKWFRRLLRDIGLRDETPHKKLVGMHAFRSTVITRFEDLDVSKFESITGHSNGKSRVLRGYDNGRDLPYMLVRLVQLQYDLTLPMPLVTNA